MKSLERSPELWCPPLTHFCAANTPDELRIRTHLKRLTPSVHGLLVPGSTGEAWQMKQQLVLDVVELFFEAVRDTPTKILIGLLKSDADSVLDALEDVQMFLQHPNFAGITVCPAKTAGQDQSAIKSELERILQTGISTAIYQLPQITGNEVSAQTIAELASQYSNFAYFKDTSGLDRVALSGVKLDSVKLLRGSEENGYARWLRAGGGPYDGFLLSTVNSFAAEFKTMMALQHEGSTTEAERLSAQLQGIIQSTFQLVSQLSYGNPFTNANKLLDHVFAYGSMARKAPAPMLLGGQRLPEEYVHRVIDLLATHQFDIGSGYLYDS